MVVLGSADVNHAAQLNVHENVNTARSLNTDTSAARYADAESVRWLAVQPHANVDSVDTSRNTTNTDAESDVDANHVNQLNVHVFATGDSRDTSNMAA